MAKKVTGRTDQGSKEYPGDEAYKKLFAKMLEEDKKKEKKKSEKKIGAKESKGLLKADDSSIKKIHGTISKLTGHVRKAVIRIGSLEKRSDKIEGRADKIEEKTSKIVNILKSQKSKIGEKIPGSNKDTLNKTLVETNKILVDILNQLTLQSKEEQKRLEKEKSSESILKSKKKLKKEESLLEKTSKGIRKVSKKIVSKAVEPIGNIFGKIVEFITLLGAGIATNATLEWFKDEENQKKITKIFNILKENWKLLANIFGTIIAVGAILKVAAAITTIGSVLALLGNPVVLAFLAGAGILFGTMAAYDAIASNEAGGALYLAAHQELDKEMQKAGMTPQGTNLKRESVPMYGGGGGTFGRELPLTEAQISVRDSVLEKRKQLRALQSARDAEIKGVTDENEKLKIRNKYEIQIPGILGKNIEARKLGGPVTAGQPYLVGERGPEIFSPNINGSIVNNMRTEKIVQTLSSDMGEGSINMIELPPITNQMPPPEIPVPTQQATDVPEISSTNMADPYRQLSPLLYGITV